MIKQFRTSHTLSIIARGSIVNGYNRATFNPATYLNRGQDDKQMHYSCLGVLSDLIPRITAHVQFSLIRPAPTGKVEFLYIDPVGVLLMQSLKDNSAVTTALLVDHNIQVPAKFIYRLNKRKIDAEHIHSTTSIVLCSIWTPETISAQDRRPSWIWKLHRKNVNVCLVQLIPRAHRLIDQIDQIDQGNVASHAMPTPPLIKGPKARASRKLQMNAKPKSVDIDDGNVMITGELRPDAVFSS